MIDRRLDGLGVDGLAVGQRAELCNQGFRGGLGIGEQRRP